MSLFARKPVPTRPQVQRQPVAQVKPVQEIPPPQQALFFCTLPKEECRQRVNPANPLCPLYYFVGNERAKKTLGLLLFGGLNHPTHCVRESIILTGPPSAGKTTLSRLSAEVLETPFIEVSPTSIQSIRDLYNQVAEAFEKVGRPLRPVEITRKDGETYLTTVANSNWRYIPPCVVFIDEVHRLPKAIQQGLLKATEKKDNVLVTEDGLQASTESVWWQIATTKAGRLDAAFLTRFSEVELEYLSNAELAQVIELNFPALDEKTCQLIAHYRSRIARKSLEFARQMVLLRDMDETKSWTEVAAEVARINRIDEYGMHETHLAVLKELYKGPVSLKRMVSLLNKEVEEVENLVMPWLLCSTEDQPAMVKVSSKGFILTDAGMEELVKRGLAYHDVPDDAEEASEKIGGVVAVAIVNSDDYLLQVKTFPFVGLSVFTARMAMANEQVNPEAGIRDSITEQASCTVNGRQVSETYILQDGDTIVWKYPAFNEG